jgi:hypothetical protein
VLEKAGWVLSRGCDFSLAICVLNNNRACRLGSSAATELQKSLRQESGQLVGMAGFEPTTP